ncbi:MAG: class I SAM-dependent methyltransferase [Pseudomonas sp.]
MIEDQSYKEDYYRSNGQDGDRPALIFFERLAKRFFSSGMVLDFGCGAGHLLHRLQRSFQAIGVEASDWARHQVATTGAMVHASSGSIETGSLTGIISVHVVEHIPDDQLREVLSEWRRILQPSGRALVVTPDAGGYAARVKGNRWVALTDPTHINLKTHEQWVSMFEGNGFDVVRAAADGLWDFPYRISGLGKAEVFLLGWPTLAQFILGRLLLKPGTGESSIFLLQRR